MSVFTYNGVTLPYARIIDFRQEALYDDLGGTDWYVTRYDIRVEAVVYVQYLNHLAPDLLRNNQPGLRNPADIMSAIRTRLLEPRKALSITFNGQNLIPATQHDPVLDELFTNTVDAQNGPKPQSVNILELNNTTFLIQYHVTAHYWECPEVDLDLQDPVSNRAGNNVLYNRWSETVDIDECMMSRRTRDGKFMIRSDNVNGRIADRMREAMAVLGVEQGFVRESSSYTVTPDGLAMTYRIVDREFFKVPPFPAYKAEGQYTESSTVMDAKRYAEVWVRLTGAKVAPLFDPDNPGGANPTRSHNVVSNQLRLLSTAVSVCTSKLNLVGAPRRPGQPLPGGGFSTSKTIAIPQSAAVMVDLYNNVVEVRIRAMFANATERVKGIDIQQPFWAYTPLSDPLGGPPKPFSGPYYYERGSAGLVLQAAAYYDPCLRTVGVNPVEGQLWSGLVTAGGFSFGPLLTSGTVLFGDPNILRSGGLAEVGWLGKSPNGAQPN